MAKEAVFMVKLETDFPDAFTAGDSCVLAYGWIRSPVQVITVVHGTRGLAGFFGLRVSSDDARSSARIGALRHSPVPRATWRRGIPWRPRDRDSDKLCNCSAVHPSGENLPHSKCLQTQKLELESATNCRF